MSAALEATALTKRYGATPALTECDLRIPAGHVVALVGPNGAGKTTLLHLAMGFLNPTAGDIKVFGWSPQAQPTIVLPRVGFLAQDRPLYRRFKVRDLLEFGRRLNPRWDGELARLRLERLAIPLHRPVGKLSGGQEAQVALALTLAKKPDMLLLDEPLSNLDPLARREFMQVLMDAVAEEGLTVVLSSHIIADLERTCDYLVILAQGQVQLAGEIEGLLDSHRMLVGGPSDRALLGRDTSVIHSSHTPRQTTMLVKLNGRPAAGQWEEHHVGLEQLVLAYLSRPSGDSSAEPEPAENSEAPMIWVTWAQHRREALVSGLILTAAAALLVITGLIILADFKSSGAASCAPAAGPAVGVFSAGTSCESVLGAFYSRWSSLTGTAWLALMTLPVLLGVFIAAPLLSREFEQRTHLFAWSQSITRLRWVVVKLGLVAAVVLISAAALTVLVIWWRAPLDRAFSGGPWVAFDIQGLAPIGYAVFALSLGTLAGLVLRRTVPAMALTLFVFVGVRILIGALVRPHFMTAVTGSAPDLKQGSWVLSASYYTDAQGHHLSFEQVNQMVTVYASTNPKTFTGSTVMAYLHQRGVSLLTDYQPPDRFWTFQLIEAALFFGLAIGLIAASLWWLQRRA